MKNDPANMRGPCPKCGEVGSMIERHLRSVYGVTVWAFFCNVCAHDWTEPHSDDEVREK